MAGLIRALFGGRSRPPDPNPLPGLGGYRMPRGPAGESGFPGSTAQTRTMRGNSPRVAGLRADSNTGWDSGLGSATIERQASYRGDIQGAAVDSPRRTGQVRSPQGVLRQRMQTNDPSEFFGGPALRTRDGNQTAGGNPLSGAAQVGGHSVRETETPPVQRQPIIAVGVPGSQNVRNTIALRYKQTPGQVHQYQSAARPDQAPVNLGGQSTDGNVKPWLAATPVSVPSRFVFAGGGNQTWTMLRQMPYGGRGDGARGAALSGIRYYATGQADQFFNAGQGDYGIGRSRGSDHKRPVSFATPAPWTTNFYDTTDSVGTQDAPGTPTQAPNLVYTSPTTGRASNGTGRTG